MNKISKKSTSEIQICRSENITHERSKKIKLKSNKFNNNINKVLLDWIFAHSKNPYPTHEEKVDLIKKTGLSKKQLNIWFVNTRKRALQRKELEDMKKSREADRLTQANNDFNSSKCYEKHDESTLKITQQHDILDDFSSLVQSLETRKLILKGRAEYLSDISVGKINKNLYDEKEVNDVKLWTNFSNFMLTTSTCSILKNKL